MFLEEVQGGDKSSQAPWSQQLEQPAETEEEERENFSAQKTVNTAEGLLESFEPQNEATLYGDSWCGLCQTGPALLPCSNCETTFYCSQRCKMRHLFVHKADCDRGLSAKFEHVYGFIGCMSEHERVEFLKRLPTTQEASNIAPKEPMEVDELSAPALDRGDIVSLVRKLISLPESLLFRALPDSMLIGDYHDVVLNPISLGDMLSMAKNGAYRTLNDFRSDMERLVSNCELYNGKGCFISLQARYLLGEFEAHFAQCPSCVACAASLKSLAIECKFCSDVRCTKCAPCICAWESLRQQLALVVHAASPVSFESFGEMISQLHPEMTGVLCQMLEEEGLVPMEIDDQSEFMSLSIPKKMLESINDRVKMHLLT